MGSFFYSDFKFLFPLSLDEDKPLRERKKTRKKNKEQLPLPFSHLLDDTAYQDFDVSEEFLTTILKYVDDLCNIIR